MVYKISTIKLSANYTYFLIHKNFRQKIDNPNIKYLPFLLTVIKTARR